MFYRGDGDLYQPATSSVSTRSEKARDLYLKCHKADHTRDLIDERYQKPEACLFEAKHTPAGCLHRKPSEIIRMPYLWKSWKSRVRIPLGPPMITKKSPGHSSGLFLCKDSFSYFVKVTKSNNARSDPHPSLYYGMKFTTFG
jgi:hypothetical protein